MVRALALALALATAVCGVKGAPRPPLAESHDGGTAARDGGGSTDGGAP